MEDSKICLKKQLNIGSVCLYLQLYGKTVAALTFVANKWHMLTCGTADLEFAAAVALQDIKHTDY